MISLFFDSQITYDESGTPIYDRPNNAEQLREMFKSLLTNGVVTTRYNANMSPEVGLMVTHAKDMTVSVNAGMCWIEGACGWNKEKKELMLDSGGQDVRIDFIVARMDLSPTARNVDLYVKKGPGGDRFPSLQRDSTVYELCLASIMVPAHSTAISGSDITDTRLDTNVCGIVTGFVKQIDTSALYNQIQSDLAQFKTQEQADFLQWFEEMKTILDENTAATLLSMIQDRVEKSMLGKPNGVATLDDNSKLLQMPTATDVGAVPTSRTINNKPLSSNVTLTANDIGTNALFLAVHPVGDIYMTTVSTNPGSRFGGTWIAWGSGRVPVGVNTSDSSFSSVERTGGQKTHTLTVNEIPSHDHYMKVSSANRCEFYWGCPPGSPQEFNDEHYGSGTYPTGGGQSHNNLQPYITCYMWKRTA